MKKGLLVGGLCVLGFVLLFGGMHVSYTNGEVRLRNQLTAQQDSNKAVFDNTWKILQQQAGVTDQYKEAFKEIYPALMEGRYKEGGQMMKWVQESNPDFDTSLYKTLMVSIEAQRTTFTRAQRQLIDLKREHDNLLQTIPAKWFVGDKDRVEIVVVTSGKTNNTFDSGQEDNVDLFGNK